MIQKIISKLFKSALMFIVLMGAAATPQKTHACDADDELPGALPPAPNGGELGEAERPEKKENPTGPSSLEQKLFWEGVHLKSEKQIHLSLVRVMPPKTAIFAILPPEQEFSDLRVKIEVPREQRFLSVPFTVQKDRIIVNFDAKGLNRFIIHIEGNLADGPRKALVQIEEE